MARSYRLSAAIGVLILFATAAHAGEPVTFLIDWLPAGDNAVIYLGVEKGLFREAGLDVTIRSGRGSSDVVTKLGTGVADMGMGGLSALLQAKAQVGAPVTAVAAIYTKQPDSIFTTSDSKIARLKDLVGKTIGTATFSSSNIAWPLVLKANAIEPDAIKVLKVDPGALAPMLATGRIDATINWLPAAPAFTGPLNAVGKSLKILPWSEFGYEGYGLSLFASDKMIAKRPDAVRKFVAAFQKATKLANADPASAAAALKKAVPEIEVERAAEEWKASIPLIDNGVSMKNGVGVFAPDLLAITWTWTAKAQGMAPSSFDPAKAVTDAFLPAGRKAEQ